MRFWIPKRKPEEEPFLPDHRQLVFTRPCGSRQAASMADLIIFEERREREEKRRRRVRFLGALCGSLLLPFLSGSGIYFFVGLILIPAIYLSCTFIEQYAIFSPRGVDGLFFALPCLFWFVYHIIVSFENYQGELPFLLVTKIIGCRIVFSIIVARLSNQMQQTNCRSRSNELFSPIRYTIPTASEDLGEVQRRPRALPLGVLLSRRGKSWGCGFESRSDRGVG